jgi:hypothetical protein
MGLKFVQAGWFWIAKVRLSPLVPVTIGVKL